MAKFKTITLEDMSVNVQRVRYDKAKSVAKEIGEVIKKVLAFTEENGDSNENVVEFVRENLPLIENLLFQFTDITAETIDMVYLDEFPMILGELLSFNGVNVSKVKDFLSQTLGKSQMEK